MKFINEELLQQNTISNTNTTRPLTPYVKSLMYANNYLYKIKTDNKDITDEKKYKS
jgi:hypothetical protein